MGRAQWPVPFPSASPHPFGYHPLAHGVRWLATALATAGATQPSQPHHLHPGHTHPWPSPHVPPVSRERDRHFLEAQGAAGRRLHPHQASPLRQPAALPPPCSPSVGPSRAETRQHLGSKHHRGPRGAPGAATLTAHAQPALPGSCPHPLPEQESMKSSKSS